MAVRIVIVPILKAQVIFLGVGESYIYNGDTKTLDQNNVQLKFASDMYQKIGCNEEILSASKFCEMLDKDSKDCSLSPKVPLHISQQLNIKPGTKGILSVTVGAMGGNVYYKFVDFTPAKENGTVPSPPPLTSAATQK